MSLYLYRFIFFVIVTLSFQEVSFSSVTTCEKELVAEKISSNKIPSLEELPEGYKLIQIDAEYETVKVKENYIHTKKPSEESTGQYIESLAKGPIVTRMVRVITTPPKVQLLNPNGSVIYTWVGFTLPETD